MLEKLKEIKEKWESELSTIYGGELEIDYLDGQYYACAFHDESKGEYDSWVDKIKEISPLGNNKSIEVACHTLGIPVCR